MISKKTFSRVKNVNFCIGMCEKTNGFSFESVHPSGEVLLLTLEYAHPPSKPGCNLGIARIVYGFGILLPEPETG